MQREDLGWLGCGESWVKGLASRKGTQREGSGLLGRGESGVRGLGVAQRYTEGVI